MTDFVQAWSISTGRPHLVPAAWFDDANPTMLIRDLTLENPDPPQVPDASWKVQELKDYAADHGLDLGDATLKADILDAILTQLPEVVEVPEHAPALGTAPTDPADPLTPTTETPATGENQE